MENRIEMGNIIEMGKVTDRESWAFGKGSTKALDHWTMSDSLKFNLGLPCPTL
jgi:hypothetical protein